MKIILVSIGTRGDMEPFLAIGELLADFGLIMTARISLSWLNRSRRWSFSQISRAVRNARTIYTISPLLFPRPAYWDGNIKILGYQAIKPDDNRHPAMLYAGSGPVINVSCLSPSEA